MYAVVKTGGKQYKVQANDIIEIEKIEAGVGSTIILDNVLMVNEGSNATLGSALSGFGVAAEIIKQKKGEKIIVFKKKRRHNYRRKNGHRQLITVIKITGIGKGLKSNILPFKPEENESVVNRLKTAPKRSGKKQVQAQSSKAAKPKAEAKPAKAKKETTAKTEAKPATPRKKAAGKTKAAE